MVSTHITGRQVRRWFKMANGHYLVDAPPFFTERTYLREAQLEVPLPTEKEVAWEDAVKMWHYWLHEIVPSADWDD